MMTTVLSLGFARIRRRIQKHHFNEEHHVDFFGERLIVTVTHTPSVIRRWIYSIRFFSRRSSHPLVVGLGVQWTPGGSYPPPDTLQLGVGIRCLIIQLSHCKRMPNVLRSFLEDETITFVGVWNSQDKDKLERSHHQLDIWRLVDIRNYLPRWLWKCTFERIVEECLEHQGVKKDKEICRSNWGARSLSDDQIVQAYDVFVCCKLGVKERVWKMRA
ncbi:3'-5' exonuclease domain [Arabidopsis thaliana x Arabidopsis arenosa]|uniref:3'-5' exonuclease domain n=1 Tax=Arabidopsis thaliana x Arabidopsis arenosa TaxID=1240361 RepID=A0A8T2A7J3_9BRAS|nr:3'-5' exonuclease domain [Arabidopsis thaliana x Arabidopsis arenosa]